MEDYTKGSAEISIEQTDDLLVFKPSNGKHKYSLVFVHGRGMEIDRFYSVFLSESFINLLSDTRIVIPQAPLRKIKALNDLELFSWYDRIEGKEKIDNGNNNNEEHIQESKTRIINLID